MPVGLVRGYTHHLTPVSPGAARTDPLDQGLVGEWRFDQNTGLVLPDYSGYAGRATVSGAAWLNTVYGPALDFDGGTDHVNVPRSSAIEPSPAVTVECFYYYPGSQSAWDRIIAKDKDTVTSPYISYLIGFHSLTNRTYFSVTVDGTNRETATHVLSTGWYHLVGTWSSGDYLRYYLQGKQEQVSAAAYSGAITYYAAPLRFMAHSTAAGYNPAGKLATVRVYDRALAAAEVRERYEVCLKRAQAMTHVWMIPWASVPAPPATIVPIVMYHYRRRRV